MMEPVWDLPSSKRRSNGWAVPWASNQNGERAAGSGLSCNRFPLLTNKGLGRHAGQIKGTAWKADDLTREATRCRDVDSESGSQWRARGDDDDVNDRTFWRLRCCQSL